MDEKIISVHSPTNKTSHCPISCIHTSFVNTEVTIGKHCYDYDFDALDLEVLNWEYVTIDGGDEDN